MKESTLAGAFRIAFFPTKPFPVPDPANLGHYLTADGGVNGSTFRYYEIIRDYVKHEDDLINNRLMWALTIDGFLFAAFALIGARVPDFVLALSTSASHPSMASYIAFLGVLVVLGLISITGFVVNSLSYRAVSAANYALLCLNKLSEASLKQSVARTASHPQENAPYRLPCVLGGGGPIDWTHNPANDCYCKLPQWLTRIWALMLGVVVAAAILCAFEGR